MLLIETSNLEEKGELLLIVEGEIYRNLCTEFAEHILKKWPILKIIFL